MTQRRFTPIALAATALVLACGGGEGDANQADTTARDLSLAPAESVATLSDRPQASEPAPTQQRPPAAAPRQTTPRRTQPTPTPPPAPEPPVLPAGSTIELTATDTISSKTHQAGDMVEATVNSPIRDEHGHVVIPAGAVFTGSIQEIKRAGSPGGQGTLRLAFDRVSFGGNTYAAVAVSDTLETEMKGQGVTAGDAAKVGAGAAVGAIAGRLLGKDTKGAIIGGVVGAAAGAGVAAATKDQEIVLPADGRIQLVLQEPLVLRPIG